MHAVSPQRRLQHCIYLLQSSTWSGMRKHGGRVVHQVVVVKGIVHEAREDGGFPHRLISCTASHQHSGLGVVARGRRLALGGSYRVTRVCTSSSSPLTRAPSPLTRQEPSPSLSLRRLGWHLAPCSYHSTPSPPHTTQLSIFYHSWCSLASYSLGANPTEEMWLTHVLSASAPLAASPAGGVAAASTVLLIDGSSTRCLSGSTTRTLLFTPGSNRHSDKLSIGVAMGASDLDFRGSTVDELRRLLQSFSSDARRPSNAQYNAVEHHTKPSHRATIGIVWSVAADCGRRAEAFLR